MGLLSCLAFGQFYQNIVIINQRSEVLHQTELITLMYYFPFQDPEIPSITAYLITLKQQPKGYINTPLCLQYQ